jgi:hypothetical protein
MHVKALVCLFLNPKLFTDPPGVMGNEHTAIVRDQHLGNAVPAHRSVDYASSKITTLDQQEGLIETAPLADSLTRGRPRIREKIYHSEWFSHASWAYLY